ncbi:MAG: DUF177 domain-containing protein [Synergistaceae bacterium]|nr:DUF177 domain-containing protein [Synergistaceae bacterium]
MESYLISAPENWKCRLVLSAVPKDGAPYTDKFTVPVDRPVSYWDQIYTLLSDPEVYVEAFRSEGRIVAAISLRARVSAPCARCLDSAACDIESELRYIFSLRRDEGKRDENASVQDGEEDIILLDSWEDEIDLAQLVWETLITALPAAILCSPDCKGLCPQCGANLNNGPCGCKGEKGDPRLEILKDFIKDEEK